MPRHRALAALFVLGEGNRVIRALTRASHPFYVARAGGLYNHPVLKPRGSVAHHRPDLQRLDHAGLPILRHGSGTPSALLPFSCIATFGELLLSTAASDDRVCVMNLHERIRQRAYELWEESNRADNHALEHWLRAENELAEPARNSSQMSFKDSLSILRDVFFIVAIILFFAGWLYIYFFYRIFTITTEVLDLPLYSVYFHAINVTLSPFFIILVLVALAIWLAMYVAMPITYRMISLFITRNYAISLLSFIAIGLLTLFPITRLTALESAQFILQDQTISSIQFEFDKDGNLSPANFSQENIRTKCGMINEYLIRKICDGNVFSRLILIGQTGDYFLVLHRPENPSDAHSLYRIPAAEVTATATVFYSLNHAITHGRPQ